jgi:4-aminobutyrate aminotransferase-like enzyme
MPADSSTATPMPAIRWPCAAGLAVIEEIERQGLVANAEAMGVLLKSRLEDLMQRYSIIGDVRGKGLLTAFEFVSDRHTMAPLPASLAAYDRFVNIAYEKGLIVYSRRTRGGYEGDHILVCPPMIVNENQIDEIIEILDASLREFTADVQAALPQSA